MPRLLIRTGTRWPETSRLALGAREAGFSVDLLCPKPHPVASLEWVEHVHGYSALLPTRSVARALNTVPVDVVTAIDDFAGVALLEAYSHGLLNERAAAVVRRSLGDPASFGIRYSRVALAGIAAQFGLTTPRTRDVPDEHALPEALTAVGLPAVLKVDEGYAGLHVTKVHSLESAVAAYRRLSSIPRITSGVGGLLFDHDARVLRQALLRKTPRVSIQAFIEGTPATVSAVAWRGEILACASFSSIQSQPGNGPATVVEPIERHDMERAARVVAREFGIAGPFGLDFILSEDRSSAWLLELNPRATPTLHLHPPSLPMPLLHVLANRVGGHAPQSGPPLPPGKIALFPQAVRHGVDTEVFRAHLEIPSAPDVVRLCQADVEPAPPGRLVQTLRRVF